MTISILIYLLLFLVLLTAAYGAYSAAPWLPTRRRDVQRMMDLAEIKNGCKIYDLGCGDGRLVFEAAKRGATATGVEIFFLPWLYARIKSFFIPRTKILFGDLFFQDISDADTIFIFLLDKSYKRLTEKFSRELKPGAQVIVGCWPIAEWQDKLVSSSQPADNLPMFAYKISGDRLIHQPVRNNDNK
ncbi:MAG: class I SAM-dependent methyltransferase [Patescibacteria group bacterium]|jgi:SAM-dependent methyltransferase